MKILIYFYFFIKCSTQLTDEHFENVLIKPLREGHIYTHFQFKTITHSDIKNIFWVDHFNYFPLTIAKFFAKHKIQELHFSLTKGLWKHNLWGYPIRDAPSGAELSIYFQSIQDKSSQAWNEMTSLLSGHFCASLNFIDNAATVNPVYTYRPLGVLENGQFDGERLYYASLPHEAVCTENLTPWKKFLPCFAKSGLSSILNAKQLFNSNYFSIALDIRPICRDSQCQTTSIELTQTLSVVFNPPLLFEGYKQSWSLIKLFGVSLKEYCNLAKKSSIIIDTTFNKTNVHTLSLTPNEIKRVKFNDADQRVYAIYDVKKNIDNLSKRNQTKFNIASIYKDRHVYSNLVSPLIYASRYITGYGVSSGGITCQIHNQFEHDLQIVYFDVIPWYLRIYIHTLEVTSAEKGKINVEKFFYKPAIDRLRPHHLEMIFKLPAKSVTTVKFNFDRQYLKWTEYPPDANHGVYAGAAIITVSLPDTMNHTLPLSSLSDLDENFSTINKVNVIRLHTQTLLISLPTPDFTMPYNVICLVSTVVTLAFGPIHNLTTRRPRKAEKKSKSLFSSLMFWKKHEQVTEEKKSQ